MGIFDIFGDSSSSFGGDVPSINGIEADWTSVDDIANGKGNSSDYGRGIGAGVGAFFDNPQLGADVGATALPILNDIGHSVWDAISK